MITATVEIEARLAKLLAVLDTQIEHIACALAVFDELRRLVVKRDSDALAGLLKEIQKQADEFEHTTSARQSARNELACVLGLPSEQVTLSRLLEMLPQQKEAILKRKAQLVELVGRLRTEHARTVALMSNLARFNRMLLDKIFAQGQGVSTTYNASGSVNRQRDGGFVSMQF